jgi:hypothetical protein
MTKTMKMIVTGVVGAVGLTSAAVAQQSTQQNTAQHQGMTPEQHRQMMSGGNMGQGQMQGQMQGMTPEQHRQMMSGGNMAQGQMQMNDPKMHKEMMEMMASCTRMMQMMGNMSGMSFNPAS